MRRITLIAYYVLTVAAIVYSLSFDCTVYNMLLAVAGLALPAVPFVLYKVAHLKPVPLLEMVFNGFVFAAVSFASLFGAYDFIPLWDKILHFLSGFLFAALGTIVYFYHKPDRRLDRRDAFNAAAYTWMFSMTSAVLWEIWEYGVSLFGADPQQVALTGVSDTMQDMIVCTVGGLITAISCWKYLKHLGKNRRKGLMMSLFEKFYEANIKK